MWRLWRQSWVASSALSLPLTQVFLMKPRISQQRCRTLLRKDLGGDWPLGSGTIFLKGGELPLSVVPCKVCLSTLCPYPGS